MLRVGYKAGPWSGGSFESKKRKPEVAAAEHYKAAAASIANFTNDVIFAALVTKYPTDAWWLSLPAGADGAKAASWKIARHDDPQSMAKSMAKLLPKKKRRRKS